MKIDFGKLLKGAAKVIVPAVAVAVITHTSVKKAALNSIEDAVQRELNKRGA